MQCRICSAFKHELSRESETEAIATLRKRAWMIASFPDDSAQDGLDNLILVSRKRRARIATELYAHQEDVHGERAA